MGDVENKRFLFVIIWRFHDLMFLKKKLLSGDHLRFSCMWPNYVYCEICVRFWIAAIVDYLLCELSYVYCQRGSRFWTSVTTQRIGKAAVNHTRIRLGLSALNFQRFQFNWCRVTSVEQEERMLHTYCSIAHVAQPMLTLGGHWFSHYIEFYLTIYSDLKNILSKSYCMAQMS